MELREFFGLIRNEDVQEIIVRAKDCVYRWEEGKAFIAPFKTNSETHTITTDNSYWIGTSYIDDSWKTTKWREENKDLDIHF